MEGDVGMEDDRAEDLTSDGQDGNGDHDDFEGILGLERPKPSWWRRLIARWGLEEWAESRLTAPVDQHRAASEDQIARFMAKHQDFVGRLRDAGHHPQGHAQWRPPFHADSPGTWHYWMICTRCGLTTLGVANWKRDGNLVPSISCRPR